MSTPFEIIAASGERMRSDGLLHADVTIRANLPSASHHLMTELGRKMRDSGQEFKFGAHSYRVAGYQCDDENTVRLFVTRPNELLVEQQKRRDEQALFSLMEGFLAKQG